MLLRKLLLEDRVIGDTMMVNHTEPVGWWHFAHSFVRGHWRNESTSAPSLLTKSCHDVDFLLWLLCSPGPNSSEHAHLPSKITSTGSLQYFRKEYKPVAAGDATNCLSCPYEGGCKFSAKSIYTGSRFPGLASGNTEWPVDVIVPEIEDIIRTSGPDAGEKALLAKLSENYDENASIADVSARPWFGRCVYESDNDVLDNQTVTFTFDAIPSADDGGKPLKLGKVATFHMTALTKKVCERYTHISGADGEIYADGTSISVHNFSTGEDATFHPPSEGGGHGGGDGGLAKQFVLAIDQVKNHGIPVKEAQQEYIGCSLEEIVRSHAMVFAAEEARKTQLWLDFPSWWKREVESKLAHPDIAR
ncbi:hypothetical protein H2200_002384 [Cladophialophora chaetospira]|uniref:Gfo/Idh/MocA-like oxidoreductase C-terminal domain-containing protein n=1 Tax=Cladophialophora chaetospira TaxID=386627 RepID=A0AA38XJ09_9EURO|nr:hypothetical protein H2200_002384 [Cladophialophora chaetospira]